MMTASDRRYFGKYRGTVVDNVDPQRRGRVRLEVPDVQGSKPSTWAEACVPLAGPAASGMGMYVVPPVGTGVWVEFEAGDPGQPIWTGCRFESSNDLPSPVLTPGLPDARIALGTPGKNQVLISDVPGEGLVLSAASGARIVINEQGITLSTANGAASIKLTGNQVNVNEGALEVT
jgi:uncharacterized protein involved in type VI secretion and phage assembly